MSTSRHGDAQHPQYDPKWRGPSGRRQCRRCLKEVGKGRSTFCGDECVQAFLIATGRSGWVRPAVEKRDQGVCALCGLDTEQKPRIAALVARLMTREWSPGFTYQGQFCQGYWKSDYKTELTVRRRIGEHWGIRWSDHLWEADHIVPVAEGGGGCGLENYRTLCIPCHRKVTRELAGRLKLSREKVRRLERLFR